VILATICRTSSRIRRSEWLSYVENDLELIVVDRLEVVNPTTGEVIGVKGAYGYHVRWNDPQSNATALLTFDHGTIVTVGNANILDKLRLIASALAASVVVSEC
jgi:hypothetical protein